MNRSKRCVGFLCTYARPYHMKLRGRLTVIGIVSFPPPRWPTLREACCLEVPSTHNRSHQIIMWLHSHTSLCEPGFYLGSLEPLRLCPADSGRSHGANVWPHVICQTPSTQLLIQSPNSWEHLCVHPSIHPSMHKIPDKHKKQSYLIISLSAYIEKIRIITVFCLNLDVFKHVRHHWKTYSLVYWCLCERWRTRPIFPAHASECAKNHMHHVEEMVHLCDEPNGGFFMHVCTQCSYVAL